MDPSGSPAKSVPGKARGWDALYLPWLVTPLLYPALRWSSPPLPDAVRAFIGFLLVVLLPGWLLHLLILPRARIGLAARITRAFVLGIAVVSFLGLIAWFLGGDAGLGEVSALDDSLPAFPGRLTAVVWGEALFLFVGALLLVWRAERSRRHRTRARAPESTALPHGNLSAASGAGGATGGSTADGGGEAAGRSAAGGGSEAAGGNGADVVGRSGGRDGAPEPGPPPMQRILREAYRLGDQHKADHPVAPRWATLLVLGVIVLSAAGLGFYAGGSFGWGRDSLDHAACLQEMVQRDRILPRSSFYADGDGAAIDSRKGFFHVALAAVCLVADVDAPRLWRLLPGILAPFMLIVFHTLARKLLRTEGTALFATFLALVCFGEVTSGLFARLGYGNQMGMVLAWASLAAALHFALNERRRALLWLVGLSGFAAAATHVFSAVQILFSLGVFFVALLLFRGPRSPHFKRVGLALVAVAAGALPVLLWRFLFAYAPLNPIHTHRQGILWLSEKLFIIMPGHWTHYLMGVGFGGILLSLFLWKRARESDRTLYLASLSIAPLLIVANPFVVPLIEPYLGYLVARFIVGVPFLMVLAYMARWMGESLLELNSVRRVVTALIFYGFMVWLLFPRLEAFACSYSTSNLETLQARSAQVWEDLLSGLDAEIEEPAVILSDPFTGYSIPALTRHYTVCVLHQHGSPSDSLAVKRLAASRDVLSPYLGTGEKARICRRFGVEYVLVNGRFRRPQRSFFCDAGPYLAPRQNEALEADSDLFEKIWDLDERGGGLFRVRRENLDALSGIVTRGDEKLFSRTTEEVARGVLLRRLPTNAVPVLSDTVAGITLAAASLDTTWLARGDGTGITLYWRRVGNSPDFPVISYLRMDTEPPRGPLWMSRISKVHRNWLKQRKGATFRLQRPRVPLDGAFGPEHWPRDRYVVDRVGIRIPEAAAPGEYFVEVKWMEQTFLPNLPLEHFLTDHDAYEGVAVGVLEVY
jgi:hypothetical protein